MGLTFQASTATSPHVPRSVRSQSRRRDVEGTPESRQLFGQRRGPPSLERHDLSLPKHAPMQGASTNDRTCQPFSGNLGAPGYWRAREPGIGRAVSLPVVKRYPCLFRTGLVESASQ